MHFILGFTYQKWYQNNAVISKYQYNNGNNNDNNNDSNDNDNDSDNDNNNDSGSDCDCDCDCDCNSDSDNDNDDNDNNNNNNNNNSLFSHELHIMMLSLQTQQPRSRTSKENSTLCYPQLYPVLCLSPAMQCTADKYWCFTSPFCSPSVLLGRKKHHHSVCFLEATALQCH